MSRKRRLLDEDEDDDAEASDADSRASRAQAKKPKTIKVSSAVCRVITERAVSAMSAEIEKVRDEMREAIEAYEPVSTTIIKKVAMYQAMYQSDFDSMRDDVNTIQAQLATRTELGLTSELSELTKSLAGDVKELRTALYAVPTGYSDEMAALKKRISQLEARCNTNDVSQSTTIRRVVDVEKAMAEQKAAGASGEITEAIRKHIVAVTASTMKKFGDIMKNHTHAIKTASGRASTNAMTINTLLSTTEQNAAMIRALVSSLCPSATAPLAVSSRTTQGPPTGVVLPVASSSSSSRDSQVGDQAGQAVTGAIHIPNWLSEMTRKGNTATEALVNAACSQLEQESGSRV